MITNHQTQKIFIINLIFLFTFFLSSSFIHARKFSPHAVPVGGEVSFKGRQLIKVTTTGKFVDLEWWKAKSNTTMQGWDDCASLATPTGANFTQGPILIDVRDNKQYEIRKFADGKCWMVDNLMYGGNTDACAGKSTFAGAGSATASNRFGANTFGDCRDPRVGTSGTYCATGAGAGKCGYYYNWQAAMQHASAYYNTTYTGPTTNVQGLCPEGWRLPTSNTGGDFATLHTAAGAPASGFWQSPGNWRGYFSGFCNASGELDLGTYGYWWSSTPHSEPTYSYNLYFLSSGVGPNSVNDRRYGFAIRCLKN